MASKKKRKAMVLHQGRAPNYAGGPATDHTPPCHMDVRPESESEGSTNKGTGLTKEEATMTGHQKSKVFKAPGRPPAVKHPIISDTVSPECICKGVKVTLDNNNMWNEFFRCKTEMIVTKQGSRMFPYCRFRISGLQPSKKYVLIMDIQPADNCCYKWTGKSWQVAGKAEQHVKSLPFLHPESPSTGQHWMQSPVSFYKLKLTSNVSDQDGNVVLNLMHRYLPRLHVVETDKASQDTKLSGPNVVTFTFPQTEFMAVTAYQNIQFAQLKVHYNPFAKGLKEDGSSLLGIKLKSNSSKDTLKDADATTSGQHPVKKSLKSLLANHKPRTSKALDSKLSVPDDVQKKSQINQNQSSAKAAEEPTCKSQPAKKLISELIREAHVSLQRCNLEQLGESSNSVKTHTRTTDVNGIGQDVSKMDMVSVEAPQTSCEKQSDAVAANTSKDVGPDGTAGTGVQKESLGSQNRDSVDTHNHKALSEVSMKQHKRPAPLPLPALALFLKQHSAKSKKLKSKAETSQVSHDSKSQTQSSATPSACPLSEFISSPPKQQQTKDCSDDRATSDKQDSDSHSSELASNAPGHAIETSLSCKYSVACPNLKEPRTDDYCTLALESSSRQSLGLDDSPVLHKSDQSFPTLGATTMSSTLTTSSPVLSPALDTVLPTLDVHQTPTINESSTLPSVSKSDALLSDPECSSFGFEPLSPASSPEPLPSLPASLDLDLDSTPCDSKGIPPEELQLSDNSATSVFKWRTVLPPPSYIGNSLNLPLVEEPLIPSQTPNLPVSETLDPCMATSPSNPASSYQENEQSLPFPAELSPLALQLTLSPTFSSLDGDGLSPTPSIADLVHFFSTDDDLGIGVEFPNSESVALPCPPPAPVEAASQDPPQQQVAAPKPSKQKRKAKQRKLPKMGVGQKTSDSNYTTMQPNLEEVEEQLFISFTSKEALKLHIVDSSEGPATVPTTPEVGLEPSTEDKGNVGSSVEAGENFEESIAAFEKFLLRDLRLMKHRQIIHPVLQEVGLKMNLLDPYLSIDLQYLGVRLPIPPPGSSLEPPTQELPTPQGVCPAFMSRTGKTTDVTQIKGWREKFTPSASSSSKEEGAAVVSPEPTKKNLSAFCSDMLDEYLENEGKLIDERAASFSQTPVEPPVYELPARSSSYVRTLDSVLKKNTGSSPTSDLISGFIPPSKRPKHPLRGPKAIGKAERKQRGPKPNTHRLESASATDAPPAVQNTTVSPLSEDPTAHQSGTTEPLKSRKNILKDLSLAPLKPPTLINRRRRKHKILDLYSPTQDMAPLESDSELGQTDEVYGSSQPMMTRALLKQKQLEDGVMWEGRPRTCITKERASIALTSLFTLMGFVSENPTAPIQLPHRRPSPCLNDFCQLGCICGSLSYSARISHCGRANCMFGCSCLKQKVVLLKNLEGSDSSPSRHGNIKKRKRKRRMKMAYVLKEADSVSHPAERVRSLWKKDDEDSDPEPINVPKSTVRSHVTAKTEKLEVKDNSSCARVRAFQGKIHLQKNKEVSKNNSSKGAPVKSTKGKGIRGPKPKQLVPQKGSEPVPSDLYDFPTSPEAEPKPSRRLIIEAGCRWQSDADRSRVMKVLCEAMARNQLKESFWIRKYLVQPVSQTVEESDGSSCIEYKVHISQPKWNKHGTVVKEKKSQQQTEAETPFEPVEAWQQEVMEDDEEPPEYWQSEVMEEEEEQEQPVDEPQRQAIEDEGSMEDWQRDVMKERPLEDWQQEVEEDDFEQEDAEASSSHQVPDLNKCKQEMRQERKKNIAMGLPFLKGICPAGFLSATKKQQDGNDHLIQVNGKLYPLAKIQLGEMGALHPANRLAAYLTGRVRTRAQKSSPPLSSQCPPNHTAAASGSSALLASSSISTSTPQVSTTLTTAQPPVMLLTVPTVPTGVPPAGLTTVQSAASLNQSAAKAPAGSGKQVIKVRLLQTAGKPGSDLVLQAAPRGPTPVSGSAALNSSRVLMIRVPSPALGAPRGQALHPLAPKPQATEPAALESPAPEPPAPEPPAPKHLATRLPSTTQKMFFQPLKSGPWSRYYRRSDGKIVQLIPIDKLKPMNLPLKDTKAPLLPPNVQTVSGLSGLNAFTVPRLPSIQTVPSSDQRSQREMVNFKIAPSTSDRERITVTCSKVPFQPPAKLVAAPGSFTVLQPQQPPTVRPTTPTPKPAAGQSIDPSVKPPAVAEVRDLLKSQSTSSLTTTGTTSAPAESTVKSADRSKSTEAPADVAYNLADLDIIYVDKVEESLDVVEVVDSSSEETENSSDFDESDLNNERKSAIENQRSHSLLERKRRGRLSQLMGVLKQEVGLGDKMSKVSTLTKAITIIDELKTTEGHLRKRKAQLKKKREMLLNVIVPAADKCAQGSTQAARGTANTVVDDWPDVLTEDSSDEKEIQTRSVKTSADMLSMSEVFRAIGSLIKDSDVNDSNLQLLEQAHHEIKALQLKTEQLKREKVLLNKKRDSYVKYISKRSGKDRLTILRKLQHLSFKQSQLMKNKKLQSANQHPVAGGLASEAPATEGSANHPAGPEGCRIEATPEASNVAVEDDDVILVQSDPKPKTTQQPVPKPVSKVRRTPVQRPKTTSQAARSSPHISAAGPVSYIATAMKKRPKTIPNILSRHRNRPQTTETLAASQQPAQALVPAELVSLFGNQWKQVLDLNQLMTKPTVFQPPTSGVTSVTLNLPTLTNQELHLTSAGPPLSAAELSDLLNLAQPLSSQQPGYQHGQLTSQLVPVAPLAVPASPIVDHTSLTVASDTTPVMPGITVAPTLVPPEVSASAPVVAVLPSVVPAAPLVFSAVPPLVPVSNLAVPEAPPLVPAAPPVVPIAPLMVPPASDESSGSINKQTIVTAESDSCPGPKSSVRPANHSAPEGAEDQCRGSTEDPQGLKSLLNEIFFLNQTVGCPPSPSKVPRDVPEDVEQQQGTHSPWLLQLDSDSNEDPDEAELNGQADDMQGGQSKESVLTPPPLLQMKVGGAKVADPSSSDMAAGESRGQQMEAGVAWRPMPRLVPLGLRGAPPS